MYHDDHDLLIASIDHARKAKARVLLEEKRALGDREVAHIQGAFLAGADHVSATYAARDAERSRTWLLVFCITIIVLATVFALWATTLH